MNYGTASVNCCPGGGVQAEPCFLDPAGIPRCYGTCGSGSATCDAGCTSIDPYNPGCCLGIGQACNFSGECCNYLPCLPDDAGVRVCTALTCMPIGATCQLDAGQCCNGTSCLPAGELTYACQVPSDGGILCEPNDAGCDAGSQCCSAICGANSHCSTPRVCEPLGGLCTLTADCCAGLSCSGGKCQTSDAGSCGQLGQSCSMMITDGGSVSTCCVGTGLVCVNPLTGVICDNTTACNCQIVIQ